jgi:hypothetical protein
VERTIIEIIRDSARREQVPLDRLLRGPHEEGFLRRPLWPWRRRRFRCHLLLHLAVCLPTGPPIPSGFVLYIYISSCSSSCGQRVLTILLVEADRFSRGTGQLGSPVDAACLRCFYAYLEAVFPPSSPRARPPPLWQRHMPTGRESGIKIQYRPVQTRYCAPYCTSYGLDGPVDNGGRKSINGILARKPCPAHLPMLVKTLRPEACLCFRESRQRAPPPPWSALGSRPSSCNRGRLLVSHLWILFTPSKVSKL